MDNIEGLKISIGREDKLVHLSDLLPLIEERLAAGQKVKFTPYGTSMLPMLVSGVDNVTLAIPPKKLKKYDVPLYIRDNGSFVLHRVVKVRDKYTCIGDNQFVLEKGISHQQVVAVLVAFTKNGKEHSINELGYKLYCRFWHYSRPVRLIWRRTKAGICKIFRMIIKSQK